MSQHRLLSAAAFVGTLLISTLPSEAQAQWYTPNCPQRPSYGWYPAYPPQPMWMEPQQEQPEKRRSSASKKSSSRGSSHASKSSTKKKSSSDQASASKKTHYASQYVSNAANEKPETSVVGDQPVNTGSAAAHEGHAAPVRSKKQLTPVTGSEPAAVPAPREY